MNPVEKIRAHAHVLLDNALDDLETDWVEQLGEDSDGDPQTPPDVDWLQVDVMADEAGDERVITSSSNYVRDITMPEVAETVSVGPADYLRSVLRMI